MNRLRQRQPRVKNDRHLRWIRTLPCLVTGKLGSVEASHIRFSDSIVGKRETGKGERPDDRWAVPLDRDQHRAQHSTGEREYWKRLGIDPLAVAMALYSVSGDDEAGCEILRQARERNSR